MNQEKSRNFIVRKSKKIKGNSMFKFCINRKNFNFFNRKENNFLYRLTSYPSIRILGRQIAGTLQGKCRQFAGRMQVMCRQNAGSLQAIKAISYGVGK